MIADRWGVVDAEVTRRYPCDAEVAVPSLQAWRGVTVRAPAAAVWPWVRQIRVAPYSYDWIDNLGQQSPSRLLDLPDPEVGDPFTATRGRPLGRVTAVEPGVHLTGTILGAHLSYVVTPVGDATTRLVLKVVMAGQPLLAPLVSLGDLLMARRQLLNLARLAEGSRVG